MKKSIIITLMFCVLLSSFVSADYTLLGEAWDNYGYSGSDTGQMNDNDTATYLKWEASSGFGDNYYVSGDDYASASNLTLRVLWENVPESGIPGYTTSGRLRIYCNISDMPISTEHSVTMYSRTIVDETISKAWIEVAVPSACDLSSSSSYKKIGMQYKSATYNIEGSTEYSDIMIYEVQLLVAEASAAVCDSNMSSFPCDISGAYNYSSTVLKVLFSGVTGTVNSGDFSAGTNWVYVNSSSALNVPATINFSGVSYPTHVNIIKDGALCVDCENVTTGDDYFTFDVTGFSNYTYNYTACFDGNLSTICYCDENLSWTPEICTIAGDFNLANDVASLNQTIYVASEAVFDGQGHTISRANIDSPFLNLIGDDITFRNMTVTATGTGGAAGKHRIVVNSTTAIDNITFDTFSMTASVGKLLLVGNAYVSIEISNITIIDSYFNTGIYGELLYPSSSSDVNIESSTLRGGFDIVSGGKFERLSINDSIIRGDTIYNAYQTMNLFGGGEDINITNSEILGYGSGVSNADVLKLSPGNTALQDVLIQNNTIYSQQKVAIRITGNSGRYFTNIYFINNTITGSVRDNYNTEVLTNGFHFEGNEFINTEATYGLTLGYGSDSAHNRYYFDGGNTYSNSLYRMAGTVTYVLDDAQKDWEMDFYAAYSDSATFIDDTYGHSIVYNDVAENGSVTNITAEMQFGDLWAWVNSTSFFNRAANITFDNLAEAGANYYAFKDDVLQTEGVGYNLTASGADYLTIEVSGFSNWSISTNDILTVNSTTPSSPLSMIAGEDAIFNVTINEDLINQNYTYYWSVDSTRVSTQHLSTNYSTYTYITDFEDYGTHNLSVIIDDGYDNSSISSWNVSVSYSPLSLVYAVADKTTTTMRVDWTTNATSVQIYVDDVLRTTTSSLTYTIESLSPNTQYEIMMVPVAIGLYGMPRSFNETTEVSDDNAPVMQSVVISPASGYTDTIFTGSCTATDIDSPDLVYNYYWKVNGLTVKSGTTSVATQGVAKSVGTLLTTYYSKMDNLTLTCIANDGILLSDPLNDSLVINNSQAEISEVFLIEYNATDYICNHTYLDADGDVQITPSYKWYKNGAFTGETSITSPLANYSNGDEIVCEVTTGDGIAANVTSNSSTFVVGDTTDPLMEVTSIEISAYTDTAMYIEATCSDDTAVASGHPVLRFIDPNLEQKQYSFYHDSGDTYFRYVTFSTAGAYTNVNIECCDGSGNCVDEDANDITASVRQETVTIIQGGGGGAGGEEEEFRNITSFNINPQEINIVMSPGSTRYLEIEVENNDIVDIIFTALVLRDTTNGDAYDWVTFENEKHSVAFKVETRGALGSNSKFLRYVVSVPADADVGSYSSIIEISGLEQTEDFKINLEVQSGVINNLLSFFQKPVIELPVTKIDADTGEETNRAITIGVVAIIIVALAGISLLIWKLT
jgi:hypothetical protein